MQKSFVYNDLGIGSSNDIDLNNINDATNALISETFSELYFRLLISLKNLLYLNVRYEHNIFEIGWKDVVSS